MALAVCVAWERMMNFDLWSLDLSSSHFKPALCLIFYFLCTLMLHWTTILWPIFDLQFALFPQDFKKKNCEWFDVLIHLLFCPIALRLPFSLPPHRSTTSSPFWYTANAAPSRSHPDRKFSLHKEYGNYWLTIVCLSPLTKFGHLSIKSQKGLKKKPIYPSDTVFPPYRIPECLEHGLELLRDAAFCVHYAPLRFHILGEDQWLARGRI